MGQMLYLNVQKINYHDKLITIEIKMNKVVTSYNSSLFMWLA